jgi:hypothetical protein
VRAKGLLKGASLLWPVVGTFKERETTKARGAMRCFDYVSRPMEWRGMTSEVVAGWDVSAMLCSALHALPTPCSLLSTILWDCKSKAVEAVKVPLRTMRRRDQTWQLGKLAEVDSRIVWTLYKPIELLRPLSLSPDQVGPRTARSDLSNLGFNSDALSVIAVPT